MEGRNNIEKLNSINNQAPLDDGDDLFSPSEKVWENVSKQLPIKKKRRPVIPIFIIGLCLAVGAIYLWNGNQISIKEGSDIDQSSATLISNPEKISNTIPQNTSEKEYTQKAAKDVSSSLSNTYVRSKDSEHYHEKTPIVANEEKKTKFSLSNSPNQKIENQKTNKDKSIQPLDKIEVTNVTAQTLDRKTNTDAVQNNQPRKDDANQMIVTYSAEDSIANKDDSSYITREILEIRPLTLTSPLVVKETIPSIEDVDLIKPHVVSSSEWMFGIAGALSPTTYNSPKVTDPLEGTIKQSAYQSVAQLNVVINKSISKHFFISIDPGLRYDRLNTAYDLNIPYNYNTEVSLTDKKENYFSHSLPTDLGNIKTRMVVVRASDSPVVHNEDINISFDVNYKTLSVTSPIGFHYTIKNKFEGFYMGVRFVPQYVITRNAEVTKYESHHTYVKSDHVDVSKVSNYTNLYLGGDVQVGYRLPLQANRISLDINATYHKNLMSEGRPHDLGIGLAILKSF